MGGFSRYFAKDQMWGLFVTSLAFCQGFAIIQKLLAQHSDMISAATFLCFLCLLSSALPPHKICLIPSHKCHFLWEAFPDHPRMSSLISCIFPVMCLFSNKSLLSIYFVHCSGEPAVHQTDKLWLHGIYILMGRQAVINTWFNQTLMSAIKSMRIEEHERGPFLVG